MNIEFNSILQNLDGLHYSFNIPGRRYIILFKLCRDPRKGKNKQIDKLIIRVFDGSYFWIQELNQNTLERIRQKSLVEGIDATLIDMIKTSMETQSFQLKQNEEMNLYLELQFQLGRGVHVKGELPLGQAIPVCDDEDFKMMNQLFVFDLYDAVQNQMKQKVANLEKENLQFTVEYQLRDQNLKHDQSKGPQVVCAEPMFKHMKVKAKADMVRPNMRKRRGIGAKLE